MGHKPRPSKSASPAKRFMFLTIGFEKPSPEEMEKWGAWFQVVGDRIIDQGGFWTGGTSFTKTGIKSLPFGQESTTGFLIFSAKDLSEAKKLAKSCPIVSSNQLYEIMS